MQAFELADLLSEHGQSSNRYHEFLHIPSMSVGLYRLLTGATDPQSPHTEDELYYVLSGKALINVSGEDRPVKAGSLIFVGANVPHKFHSIEEDLDVLVFFAPAEYSLRSV